MKQNSAYMKIQKKSEDQSITENALTVKLLEVISVLDIANLKDMRAF